VASYNLSGIINIGQFSSNTIKFEGTDITKPTDPDSTAFLMINSSGAMTTTYASNPINFDNISSGNLTAGTNYG